MNDVQVTVGGTDVYASGSIISKRNEPIRLKPFSNAVYFLEFRFIADSEGSSKLSWYPEDVGFVVELHNVHNLDGNQNPIHVANHNGRKVLLNIVLHRVSTTSLTAVLTYTLFDGGEL